MKCCHIGNHWATGIVTKGLKKLEKILGKDSIVSLKKIAVLGKHRT
jgi:hypothetical protein